MSPCVSFVGGIHHFVWLLVGDVSPSFFHIVQLTDSWSVWYYIVSTSHYLGLDHRQLYTFPFFFNLYIRQRSWANVMYSPLFVCFVTLQNRRFLQSILVTTVCLSVCLSACLSVCPSVRDLQATPLDRSSRTFDIWCILVQGPPKLFFFEIGSKSRSRSPLLWKSHNGPWLLNRKWQRLLVSCITFLIEFRFCQRPYVLTHDVTFLRHVTLKKSLKIT